MNTPSSVCGSQSDNVALTVAIAANRRAETPRPLDAQVARTTFPVLAGLAPVDEAIWLQEDGLRGCALCYPTARAAATSLVSSACWIDTDTQGRIACGAHGEWTCAPETEVTALCIAALSAKIAEAAHGY